MTTYKVGYMVGSLATASINRKLARALIRLAPSELEFVEVPIKDLPLYSYDYDADYPAEGRALKDALASVDAVLFVTPEYNRSIPGALKNAIDWASRPPGQNSFAGKPSAVIGASPGKLGTALAQNSLRPVLGYCNSPQMTTPEAYIHVTPGVVTDDGKVTDASTARFLQKFMAEFRTFIARVLTHARSQVLGISRAMGGSLSCEQKCSNRAGRARHRGGLGGRMHNSGARAAKQAIAPRACHRHPRQSGQPADALLRPVVRPSNAWTGRSCRRAAVHH